MVSTVQKIDTRNLVFRRNSNCHRMGAVYSQDSRFRARRRIYQWLVGIHVVAGNRDFAQGRSWEVFMHPFSFYEFSEYREVRIPENVKRTSVTERSRMRSPMHHVYSVVFVAVALYTGSGQPRFLGRMVAEFLNYLVIMWM